MPGTCGICQLTYVNHVVACYEGKQLPHAFQGYADPANLSKQDRIRIAEAREAPVFEQHQKLDRIKDKSHTIGEFLEWLTGVQGVSLMKWEPAVVDTQECRGRYCDNGTWMLTLCDHVACKGTGYIDTINETWMGDRRSIQQLLADYFQIDYPKLMAEKDDMLSLLRSEAFSAADSASNTPRR